jgi:hypothetical protein
VLDLASARMTLVREKGSPPPPCRQVEEVPPPPQSKEREPK